MEMSTYIHYGSNHFDTTRFRPVLNTSCFNKPIGGLWASSQDTEFGWKEWCLQEAFKTDCLKKHFSFVLKPSAKVLIIKDTDDLKELPRICDDSFWVCLDFEQLAKHYDAIELKLSNCPDLYFALLGWDCDSLLVMNPDMIKVI